MTDDFDALMAEQALEKTTNWQEIFGHQKNMLEP